MECSCCTLRLVFPVSAPLGELTGIVVTNTRTTEVNVAGRSHAQIEMLDAPQEQFFYGPPDFHVAPRPEEEAVEVSFRHNCLLPDSEYSFVVSCVYSELRVTPPVVVNSVRTPSETIPLAADSQSKLSVMYHTCCYASLVHAEADLDLKKQELVVLSVDRESRSITLLSPAYILNCVIPLRAVCDLCLISQGDIHGVLVTVVFE